MSGTSHFQPQGVSGVTDDVDHKESRRDHVSQLKYIWYGKGADVKARAFDIAVTRAMERRPRAGSILGLI